MAGWRSAREVRAQNTERTLKLAPEVRTGQSFMCKMDYNKEDIKSRCQKRENPMTGYHELSSRGTKAEPHAGFMVLWPMQSHEKLWKGPCDQKSPTFGLMFCRCHLDILDNYVFICLFCKWSTIWQWRVHRKEEICATCCPQLRPSTFAYSTNHAPRAQDAPWTQGAH